VNSAITRHTMRRMGTLRPMRRGSRMDGGSSRISGFVAAVLARHASGNARVPGTDRVTRRHGMLGASVARHTHLHVLQMRVHLAFRLAPHFRTRPDAAPLRAWARPGGDGESLHPTSAHARMLERIVARERRVHTTANIRELLRDAVTASAAPRRTPSSDAAPAPPPRPHAVEMVVRRSSNTIAPEAPAAPPTAPPATPRDTWAIPLTPLRPSPSITPIPLSPIELGRLTDRVVRALDRRAMAERERQGRV
jgi:hypothetical protein